MAAHAPRSPCCLLGSSCPTWPLALICVSVLVRWVVFQVFLRKAGEQVSVWMSLLLVPVNREVELVVSMTQRKRRGSGPASPGLYSHFSSW